jgi:hypothetical protein
MIVSNAPVSEDVHVVCDWFEFAVLCNEYGIYSFDSLSRQWDTLRNSEDMDPEGMDSTEENFIDRVRNEIQARVELLNGSYPFALSISGESLEFAHSETTDDGWIYLFCLILSHPSQGPILDGSYIPLINNEVRNLFQACATFAAAGEVSGNSYAFGFPRPDRSNFLGKLTKIYQHFGEGTVVVSAVPPGAPTSQKDAQIDVIAWSPVADSAAGKRYLLGQVASGKNWIEKTIKGGPIDSFHHVWFSRCPASLPIASIFVPFCCGSIIDGSNAETINHRTYEFGHIFYRFRIPPLAKKGLELANAKATVIIERLDDMSKLRAWVEEQVQEMKRVSNNAAA